MIYRVGVMRARKRWVRPRLRQLATRLRCIVDGHYWSSWTIDDADGPREYLPDGGSMPLFARPSRPGEFGVRTCRRHCGTTQVRRPVPGAGCGCPHVPGRPPAYHAPGCPLGERGRLQARDD